MQPIGAAPSEIPPAADSYNWLLWVFLIFVILVFVMIIVGVVVAIHHNTSSSFNSTTIELGEEDVNVIPVDDLENTDVVDIGMPIELDPFSSTTYYSLFCVPAIQPSLTKEAKKYGGFHMTLFPSQKMPRGYSIVRAMQGFAMNTTQWNLTLSGITTKVKRVTSKNLLLMMVYGADTINLLRSYLQSSQTGQQAWTKPWSSNHVTLGNLDPLDVAKPSDFTSQTTWYVQLVQNPGHHWIPTERVLLYVSQGHHN